MERKRGKRKALGRGLSALVSSPPVAAVPSDVEVEGALARIPESSPTPVRDLGGPNDGLDASPEAPKVCYLPIGQIANNPEQPRQEFREKELEELAESIRALGLIQPIVVRACPATPDIFEIVAGERRWRASKLAGLETVPAIIGAFDDKETLEISIVENVQREQLNPIEEALAYKRLKEEFELTQEEVAERVGKDRATVSNYIRLLRLSSPVQHLLRDGDLSVGHAKVLLSIQDQAAQARIARKVIGEKLSVRELEGLVSQAMILDGRKRGTSSGDERSTVERSTEREGAFPEIVDRLRGTLGTKVSIRHHKSGRGKIEIEYFSEQELDRLVGELAG